VVLAVVVGWSLERFAGVAGALLPALLIGMVLALLVPARGACPVPPREAGGGADASR
jgi:hypothetical protein